MPRPCNLESHDGEIQELKNALMQNGYSAADIYCTFTEITLMVRKANWNGHYTIFPCHFRQD
jgi:hypothetical protein